jgi:hypothetical protein
MTFDPFYQLHLDDGRGDWDQYCVDYTTEAEAHDQASRMYGGTVPYRVVRVDRTVVAEVQR